jgi:hypothetical protein
MPMQKPGKLLKWACPLHLHPILKVDNLNFECYYSCWKFQDSACILIPGGFGDRGISGMILAAKYARENKVPYLGICLGMQISVIEMSRHVCLLFSPPFSFTYEPIHIDSHFDYPSLGLGPGRCRQWRVQQGCTKPCCYVHAWGTSFPAMIMWRRQGFDLMPWQWTV